MLVIDGSCLLAVEFVPSIHGGKRVDSSCLFCVNSSFERQGAVQEQDLELLRKAFV